MGILQAVGEKMSIDLTAYLSEGTNMILVAALPQPETLKFRRIHSPGCRDEHSLSPRPVTCPASSLYSYLDPADQTNANPAA